MANPDEQIPPGWRRLSEFFWQLPRIAYSFGHLGPRGPEDGPPALVIPGFIANDRTVMELRRALADAGWRVHPWDSGWNLGARADTVDRIAARLDSISADQPVLVVGWSLGGVFAREVARSHPDRVRAVITLGSPFSGDPRLNNVWRLYEWVAGHPVDDPPIERITDKPPVPTLAIWSRADGIVSPRAARGLAHESDRAVEFDCTHMAFGVSRTTARRVVQEIDSFLKSVAE
ncbi:alpha/beta fold hydrolase [Sphingomonas edaphi]|uniref:Alpha/beta fold hydrolase n=1 Tax=Sphingomonas edaphi TaxID=2315689 RepID=A0A418PY63_9SPHN|nr:alpha/beta fold hydrolase [Sphingomonas edaphi]RIX26874.1 alpha/beta fold hydrolase [Sphingomonas edaphi]